MQRSKKTTLEALVARARSVVTGQVKRGQTNGCLGLFEGKIIRIHCTPPLSAPHDLDFEFDGPGFSISHRVVSGASPETPTLMGWRVTAWAEGDLYDLDGIVLDGTIVTAKEQLFRQNRRGRYVKIAAFKPRNTVPDSWVTQKLRAYAPRDRKVNG